MSRMMQQVQLETPLDDDGVRTVVCWVDKAVRVGDIVTLKHQDGYWTVTNTYEFQQLEEIAGLKHGSWNNNI